MYRSGLVLTIFCHWYAPILQADEMQSLPMIEDAVQQCAQDALIAHSQSDSEFKINVGQLDHRLRLAACESPLTTEVEYGQTNPKNMIIKVSCSHPQRWTLRVPVKVQNFQTVAVASRQIMKDEYISETDLNMVKQDIYQLPPGIYVSKEPIIGLVAQRTIPIGTLFKQTMLKQPTLVKRGEVVKIIAHGKGISVEALGVAFSDGTKGQMVRVKNSRTQKMVEGTVQDVGVVSIPI